MIKTEKFAQVDVRSAAELRAWLEANHAQEASIWLVRRAPSRSGRAGGTRWPRLTRCWSPTISRRRWRPTHLRPSCSLASRREMVSDQEEATQKRVSYAMIRSGRVQP